MKLFLIYAFFYKMFEYIDFVILVCKDHSYYVIIIKLRQIIVGRNIYCSKWIISVCICVPTATMSDAWYQLDEVKDSTIKKAQQITMNS